MMCPYKIFTSPGRKMLLLVACLFMLQGLVAGKPDPDTKYQLKTGAERLVEQEFGIINEMKVGIITNQSARVGDRHLVDVLVDADNVEVVALFAPEHGIRGEADAGERITDGVDEQTGIPVYSLYGETLAPGPEMLEGLDALIFDIQDIGARFYTFISTMGMAMVAAAQHDIRFVVLDRPNPLGGVTVEGFVLEPGFESFVGRYPIPVTHGMSIGELALMIRSDGLLEGVASVDLHVVEVRGWSRDQLWIDTGREWIPPSPNIPDFETALVYPGACFFEATNVSEGRGTIEPFLQVGAPWMDGEELTRTLNERNLPGLRFESVRFTPERISGMASHPKLLGEVLEGARFIVEDPHRVQPVAAGVHLLEVFYAMAPEEDREQLLNEEWLGRLSGTGRMHDMISSGKQAPEIIESWQEELAAFNERRSLFLIYD